MLSIHKTYDLYCHFLALPIALADCAAQQIAIGRQKINPAPDERAPNTKFADNAFVQMLRQHKEVQAAAQRCRFVWQTEAIKKIYLAIKTADYYMQYMQRSARSFAEDKIIILRILEHEIEDHEDLYLYLEEQSIYWIDDIEYALSHAIKSCRSFVHDGANPLMEQYKDLSDEQFAHRLFLTAAMHSGEFRQIIEKHAHHWEVDRIALMDIATMMVAIAEITTFADIPVCVTLNEYIEIAKYYSTAQSSTFINGVLDQIVADLTEQNRISKYYESPRPQAPELP